AAHAGTEHSHHVAWDRAGHGHAPADPRAQRVEQRGHDGVEPVGHRHQHAVRRQVLVLGVAAPQTGWSLYGDEAVHVGHAVAPAPTVDAGQAGLTVTARLEHLHRDPIADLHAPTL